VGLVVVAAAVVCSPAFGGAAVLDGTMKNIDGKDVDLSSFKGNVVMIVNVASKCGFTPQYEQLQAIYSKYKDQGFTVLGFPANDFLRQEPGTNEEIKAFCTSKFNVEFPMFSKITVKGDAKPELYKKLTSKEENGEFGGDIGWNFTKFLVNRDGEVIARYDSKTKPDAPEVIAKIEEELAKS
jgi:glutathione peroxidase